MIKNFAIVENGIVVNVIIADDEFVALYQEQNPTQLCVEYVESHINDENVARIGEGYIGGKFVNGNQAVDLGLLSVEEAKAFGFHSGQEYKEPQSLVPESITPRQIRMILTQRNLRQLVEDLVSQSTDYSLKDWWEYSLEYRRDNHILQQMAQALSLTPKQIDEMFIEASRL